MLDPQSSMFDVGYFGWPIQCVGVDTNDSGGSAASRPRCCDRNQQNSSNVPRPDAHCSSKFVYRTQGEIDAEWAFSERAILGS
jgi:hypothetical protein